MALGVSHASLEAIRAKTASDPYNLKTKLTGAGGGGCAVTLVPDGMYIYFSHPRNILVFLQATSTAFPDVSLQALIADLESDSFQPYVVSVGGSGLGILSPYNPGLVTPPENPEAGVQLPSSLRAQFEQMEIGKLPEWAEDRGRWMFV